MPYQRISDLPSAVRDRYGERGRRAFMAAFNRVIYDQGGDESRAFATAHTAAQRAERGSAQPPDGHRMTRTTEVRQFSRRNPRGEVVDVTTFGGKLKDILRHGPFPRLHGHDHVKRVTARLRGATLRTADKVKHY